MRFPGRQLSTKTARSSRRAPKISPFGSTRRLGHLDRLRYHGRVVDRHNTRRIMLYLHDDIYPYAEDRQVRNTKHILSSSYSKSEQVLPVPNSTRRSWRQLHTLLATSPISRSKHRNHNMVPRFSPRTLWHNCSKSGRVSRARFHFPFGSVHLITGITTAPRARPNSSDRRRPASISANVCAEIAGAVGCGLCLTVSGCRAARTRALNSSFLA